MGELPADLFYRVVPPGIDDPEVRGAFASASVVCYTLFPSQRGIRPSPGSPENQPTETRTYPHARTTEDYSEF